MRVGKWYYKKTQRANGKLSTRDRQDWIETEVPAIINQEIFKAAQRRLYENRNRAGRQTKYPYLLSKRLNCKCGYRVGVKTSNKINLYYACSGRDSRALNSCDLPIFSAKKVDETVWNWVKSFFEDEKLLRVGITEYQRRQESITEPLNRELDAVTRLMQSTQNELTQSQRALVALEGSRAERTRATILNDIERLETTLDKLETKHKKLQNELGAIFLSEEDIQKIITFVNYIKQEAKEGLDITDTSFEYKRWLIERLQVEGALYVEKGQKMIKAQCCFGARELSCTIQDTFLQGVK